MKKIAIQYQLFRWGPCLVKLSISKENQELFLKEAKAVGAETVDGVSFFLRQANLQCRHFLGRTIPTELRRRFESV